jgi:hypothetical protein
MITEGRSPLSFWEPLLETWFWSREDPRDKLLGHRSNFFLACYLKFSDEFSVQRLIRLGSAVTEMRHAIRELGRDGTYLAGTWKDTLPSMQAGSRPTECLPSPGTRLQTMGSSASLTYWRGI